MAQKNEGEEIINLGADPQSFEYRQGKAMEEIQAILMKYRIGITPVIQAVDIDRLPQPSPFNPN